MMKINPFLLPDDVAAVNRRLGAVLPRRVFRLLRANEPVEDPDPPEPKKPRKITHSTTPKITSHRAQVMLAIGSTPKCYRDISRDSGLAVHHVRHALAMLVFYKMVLNIAPSGSFGAYVLPSAKQKPEPRGVFDV